MVIIGDKIYMPGGNFISGAIYIADGKITEIRKIPVDEINADIDARGCIVYPGFIDCHTHLGLYGSGIGIEGDDLNEDSDPVTPQLRAIDALDPFEPEFAAACKAGITTVVTGSGSANVIGGDLIAVKTFGSIADEMLIKPVGIKFALGENPKAVHGDKNSPPVTRMGIAALIREALLKAARYRDDLLAAEGDSDFCCGVSGNGSSGNVGLDNRVSESRVSDIRTSDNGDIDRPEFDIKSEALLPLLRGEVMAHFHCHKANDIVTAVRIAEEFNLKYTLIHCTEGHKIADFLAKKGASAVIGPIISSKSKPELAEVTEQNAGILKNAGVNVAICTDHPEIPEHYLLYSAEIAAANGLTDPIAAITSEAAKIAGIDDRVGYIKPGFDADFVIAEENPFKVKYTIINGKLINYENAQ
ncbi:MAG: amidohydrolase family protein [Ruminococcus sp.]|jgi:imidazolonepropionase-like amidohydrolase|nr:amidohydrolase family protein [Ruminococcus sp.]